MEFQFVIKEFNRMCSSIYDCQEDCPFYERCKSDEIYDIIIENPEEFENLVMTWSKEHPKPVYPTYGEVINAMLGFEDHQAIHMDPEIFNKEISEEVAKKFNIMPINLCGLTKYDVKENKNG